ncbi:MAG: ABC transporter permease [Chloroflexi bacterium]|nr:ABC transporter permease [Chloroflexota bacterium]
MFNRISSISIKEFIHLRRDWWLPLFMIVGGSLELLLVGWATSRPITNLPLMVWDQDVSAASRTVVIALENTDTFQLIGMAENMDAIQDQMDRGNINAAVVIPPDFSREMALDNGRPILSVILNGAESVPASAALNSINGAVNVMGQRVFIQRLGADIGDSDGFDPSLRVWFNESLSEALYTVPAELGLMLEFIVLLFAALSLARERELGTLEQLLVMPFSSLEIIAGKAVSVMLVGFTTFNLMLLMVHFAFAVPVRGSLLLLEVLAVGYLLVELSKGMVISIISKTQHQAFLLVLMVGMIDFMFTGYAAPVESMPPVLQFVAKFVPAHHWLEILRGILVKGAGMETLWPSVLALAILGAVIIAFSLRFVRRALD